MFLSRKFSSFFLILVFTQSSLLGQSEKHQPIHILFYNVENLFDTQDDPASLDEEFLPDGDRRWNDFRFYQKLKQLSKVILSSAGFEPPEIIGLCEVENRFVLEKLLDATPLKGQAYAIVHKDSPDERGIDVALLYRTDRLVPLSYQYIPVLNERSEVESTREILHATFLLPGEDTLHVFFNHWPSRYGGQTESEPKRMQAARALKKAISEVRADYPSAKIVIMGDLNDQPQNRSLTEGLEAVAADDANVDGELVNLSAEWQQGTIKYRQTWTVFDQIIVSDHLLKGEGWHTRPENAAPVSLPFLLEPDAKFKGQKLKRTYVGFKYHGGFSDHLPVLLKLER
ncbi:endonuclease/exonuclease/phosphatase family protein [Sunxiuqinia dokdonensis]|uniref:Endonuclease/exonuclease/phosphatase domain-containing protein n=1 Tax=Sunxiuqinia dokdonensis TaxID=1409788 RepID=A0A0L8V4A3_9BACT|nr:endonuclease/exonuclease/phosphatase family protein [Sunxiuqinia dokdonensis]KOH43057.1 hypothetical protein NC99_41440 [Sunxiuqinia dokdonensis]